MVGIDERALQQSASWNHLKTVISGIIHERPSNAISTLEARSTQAVTGQAVPPVVRTVYQDTVSKAFRCLVNPSAATDTDFATKYADQVRPLKKKKKPAADDDEDGGEDNFDEEEEEDPDAEEKGLLTDIEAEQANLREFGFGLSEVDSHRIFVSLKKLLDGEPLAQVRFWGKITGTKRDYFIAEAKIDENRVTEDDDAEEDEAEEDEQEGKPADTIHRGINKHLAKAPPKPPAEPRSKYGSVNEYVYYVSSDEERTNWVRLPDALPAQIVAASKINKLFTGDLSAPVNSHPAFPGEERHYLRAQIARISHATVVAPKDVYTTDGARPDDEDDEDENGKKKVKRFEVPAYEEVPPLNEQEVPDAEDPEAVAPVKEWFAGFSNDELLDPKFWVHIRSTILPDGRTTTFNPEDVVDSAANAPLDDGEEEPEDEDAPAAPTTFINPFLSDLSHDSAVAVEMNSLVQLPAWTVRKAPASTSSDHQRFLLRSVRWPGAVTFAETEEGKPGCTSFQTCYFGRGVKALVGGATAVAPPLPPLMMSEFPAGHLKLQRDCTRDDEAEYEPMPEGPKDLEEDEEGNEDE
jgi:radial spoke head protein 4/6